MIEGPELSLNEAVSAGIHIFIAPKNGGFGCILGLGTKVKRLCWACL